MSEERILNMIGEVDEKYIREADPEATSRKKVSAWKKIVTVAACLCLVLTIGKLIAHFNITNNPGNYILPLSVSAKELGMEEYTFGVALPEVVYADSKKVIMYDFRGIYVYNISNCELVGYSDFRPIDMTLIQGDDPTFVEVDKNGTVVRFYNSMKKYVYDTEKNETMRVDDYDEPFDAYKIEQLQYGETGALSEAALTYVGKDGNMLSLDLRYDEEEIVRYKNLILLINVADEVREYEIFK